MKNICLAISMILIAGVNAQDLHFTQYFNAPLLVNPANTGFNPDRDYRIGGNYRTQWGNIQTNPYRTMSVWGDVQLFNDRFDNAWVGLGGALMKDAAGTGNLSATKAYAAVAYHQMVGFNSLVSLGFNVGYVSKRIDFGKLTFDNQWNGKFFDVLAPAGESFTTNEQNYFDMQVGLNYAVFPTDNAYLNAGFSVGHVNRPSESFFASSNVKTTVSPRYTLFLNGVFKMNDQWILSPNAYVSKRSTAWEYVLGGQANYNLSGDGATQLIGGLYYRFNDGFYGLSDAIAPVIGFQLNDFKLTFNYDATMGALKNFNGTRGAYEVSLVKSGLFTADKSIKCNLPSFQ